MDVIESNPNGSILIGLVADINIESYKIYANNIGATELRIMHPVNDTVKKYYLSKEGFSYNKKGNFCFMEI